MTEETKKQKTGEEADLKYLYVAYIRHSLIYPESGEYDKINEAWAEYKDGLFQRLFRTQGYRLNFNGTCHYMKGMIYGPLPEPTLNHMMESMRFVLCDHHIMFQIESSGKLFTVNPNFKNHVSLHKEDKIVTQWSLYNA